AGTEPDLECGEFVGHRLRLLQAGDLPGQAGLADRLDLLRGTTSPAHRVAPWNQEVAGVPAFDLDHVAGGAEAGHLLGEDEFHWCPACSLSVRCWCRAAAPSRGRS